MPGSIWSWSLIAANNDTADADINWREGMMPDVVNDSARQMMGRVAEFLADLGGLATVAGTGDAIILTAKSAFTTLANGLTIGFKATASNTGAVTVNVNNLGSKEIRTITMTGGASLVANQIRAGGRYIMTYDPAAVGGTGAWILLNPSLPAAVYSLATSSTLNAIPRFSDTAGGTKNSGVTIDDSNNVTTAGAYLSAAGSATAPAFAFSGETNTGIFKSGTNRISIGTGGAERFAIGSTSSLFTHPLTVQGALTTSGGGATIGGDATVAGTVSAQNFYTSSTTSAILAANGGPSGAVALRPNGPNNTSGQLTISSIGAVTINGTLTVTG